MNKYIITDRRTGLGDVLLNLSACWYLGQRYNRDVIVDWRRLPYNLKNNETWERHEVNLFHCLFMSPPTLQGVNFLFPENFDEISFGPKTKDGYPFDLDHLPIVDQESKSFKTEDQLLKNSNQKFIRCSMRMGQKNDCFHRLRTINKDNFNYWFFINSMPLALPIEEEINNTPLNFSFPSNSSNSNTIARTRSSNRTLRSMRPRDIPIPSNRNRRNRRNTRIRTTTNVTTITTAGATSISSN